MFLFVCYCYFLIGLFSCLLLLPGCLCAACAGELCQRRRCGRMDANPNCNHQDCNDKDDDDDDDDDDECQSKLKSPG